MPIQSLRTARGKVVKRAIIIGILDILSILGAFFAGLWLRLDFQFAHIKPEYIDFYLSTIFIWCALSVLVFYLFRLYSSI